MRLTQVESGDLSPRSTGALCATFTHKRTLLGRIYAKAGISHFVPAKSLFSAGNALYFIALVLFFTGFGPRGFATASPAELPREVQIPFQVTEEDEFSIGSSVMPPPARLSSENEKRAKAVEFLMAALHFEQNGDSVAALANYQITLDLEPGQIGLALKVAHAYLRQGSTSAALDVLKNAHAAKPGDPRILLTISDIYWRILKNRKLAIEYAEQAQRSNPDSPEAFSSLHSLYLADRTPAKAAALITNTERGNSKNPYLWFQLVKTIARSQGSASASVSTSADLPADTAERSLKWVRRGIQLAEHDFNALIEGGDLLAALGNKEEAVTAYTKSAEIAPAEAAPRERLARILLGIGQDTAAIGPLEELARIDPSRAGIFELLADLYQKNGEIEKAATAFEKTIALTPTDPLSYIKAARVMRQLGRHDRAAQILDSSMKALPELPEVQIELAITLSLAGRHVEALSIARSVVDASNEGQGSLNTQSASYFAGGLAHKAGEFDLAAEYYKKAIEADPANAAGPYNDLGYMWLELGINLDEAGELIRRAVELEPESGSFLDSLGWYHYKKGEYKEALSYLLKAEAAAPTDYPEARAEFLAVIRDHIGDVHLAMGNVAEAIHYWTLALESNPSKNEIAEKIEREKKRLTSNTSSPATNSQ